MLVRCFKKDARKGRDGAMRCLLSGVHILCCLVTTALPLSGAVTAQTPGQRLPSFDDMRRIRSIDELTVSQDGRWAAYLERNALSADTAGRGYITVLDLVRHATRTIDVRGNPNAIQWVPGKQATLSFLTARGGRESIWRYSPLDAVTTPQPIAIADSLDGDILAFAWSPDGSSVAYIAAEEGSTAKPPTALRPAPKLVLFHDSPGDYTGPTSPVYSRDSVGAYVAVVALADAYARVVARHLVSAKGSSSISWSRSGMLLVNGAAIGVSWQSRIASGLLYTLDPCSNLAHRIGTDGQSRKRAAWSPSGEYVAELGFELLPEGRLPLSRYTLRVESPSHPGGAATFDHESDGLSYASVPMWGADDRTLYIARTRHATTRLYAIDLASRNWRALTPDTLSISRYAISSDGRVLLGVLENANQPPEVFRIDPDAGTLSRLTHNANRLSSMRLGHVDQVTWQSEDCRFTVHGFLVKPPAYDSTRRYPLIVMVHGGPGYPYTNSFVGINFAPHQIPPQLLAGAGYMVLLPNPRGDPSYGKEFEEALHNDWGPGPFADVDAGVDALVSRGLADPNRLGIAGASYGGYLTAYAIAHTGRYAAASIDDGPVDLTSEYGQNYATRAAWARAVFDGTPWTRSEVYRSQSPITHVSRVRTPVIMRYGGRSDTRDHIRQSYMLAQGFELYAGLRDSGVPVEFVLHPDQGHGIADWHLYEDWVTRNLRWFEYWILGKGPEPAGTVP